MGRGCFHPEGRGQDYFRKRKLSDGSEVLVVEDIRGSEVGGETTSLRGGGGEKVESSTGLGGGLWDGRFVGLVGGGMDWKTLFSGGLFSGGLEDGGGGGAPTQDGGFRYSFSDAGGSGGRGGGGTFAGRSVAALFIFVERGFGGVGGLSNGKGVGRVI